ncbi:hypothetical protein GOBAR_AA20827 [Gossypium barbadense]|uniref:Amino acid transporter transmembrane domain-containing protein n=1 Tax=Gossypium barbadense TaxID=3634 RepID=A0A2P5X918_GOSBA|nr:hypothetical protein GOBAR_AA20827 [Gossypium barbadense]
MLGKLRKSVAKLPFHESNLALKQVKCDACIEENGVCKCDNGDIEGMVMTEDAADQQARSGNSSFLHAVLNMSGMLIGLGQLSTPYALENGGWGSVFLLNPKSESFADIGENAFGRKGRVLTTTFIYIEIFMALVSYTISLHDNLITVLSGPQIKLPGVPNLHTSQLITVVAVLIALPSLWLRDLSSISFLSSGGILMSLVVFISVVCTAVFGSVEANHSIPFLHVKNIPAISGLYIYSYAGHFVFPNLYKAMKDPSKFTKVSIVSFAACTLLYTALAFLGAKMFGPEVNPQITLSLPRHHFITKIALWATVLTPMTKYALEFAPFAIQLENNLPDSLSSRMKLIIRGFVGSILLLVILSLALSVPYFEHVLSLTGSLVSVCICMTFPSAFYIKLSWPHISKPVLILNLSLIAFGSILGVLGTISSAKMLIKTLLRAHSTRVR